MPSAEPEASGSPSSSPSRPTSRRWLAAALGLLLLVLIAPWWEEHPIGSIDGGWMAALTDAGAHGRIVGRDLYATYGWGFQQIGLGARALHRRHSSLDAVVLLGVLLWVLGGLLLVAALGVLGCDDVSGMLIIDLVAAAVSQIQPTWIRPAALLLIVALTTRALAEPRLGNLAARVALLGAAGASLQLLAYDVGALALVTVGGAVVLTALWERQPWKQRLGRSALLAGATAGGGAAATLVICAAQARDGVPLLGPAKIAAELMRGYNPTHSTTWQVAPAATGALAALVAATLALGWLRARRSPEARREVVPLALAALASLPTTVIRSDFNHVSLACVPLVVLFCRLILPSAGRRVRAAVAGALAILALVAQSNRVPDDQEARLFPRALPARFLELRELDLARRNVPVPPALRFGDPATDLFVFPHATPLGLVAGRRLAQTFVQAYQATSSRLDAFAAARLLEGSGLEALVAEDGALDEVQAMTRNPAIFETLWRRFRLVASDRDLGSVVASAFGPQLLLRRSPAVREIPQRVLFQPTDARSAASSLALTAPASCSLLRVAFELDYPWWANLARKAAWRLEIRDGAETIVSARVVSLDAQRFETLISLLPSSETAAIFRGDAPRRTFDRLDIVSADRSLFAVQPRFVHLAAVDCLTP